MKSMQCSESDITIEECTW